jgi:5'-3' exonuclease
MKGQLTALLDLDALLHIVANVQFSAGNRSKPLEVKQHVQRFVSNICTNATDKDVVMFYQMAGHTNFRNTILPEYKGHRTTSDAVACWKPTILETFKELGAIGLRYIESDDAQSILAQHIGYDKVVIVTGDKDMIQVPTMIYNPFKGKLSAPDRWGNYSVYEANRFFWKQVLAGDPTDMPSSMCGIEGIGMGKADKLCDRQAPFMEIIQDAYTKKYGAKEGLTRAVRTYRMVRLLKLEGNTYINEQAQSELEWLLEGYKDYVFDKNQTKIFGADPSNLFT